MKFCSYLFIASQPSFNQESFSFILFEANDRANVSTKQARSGSSCKRCSVATSCNMEKVEIWFEKYLLHGRTHKYLWICTTVRVRRYSKVLSYVLSPSSSFFSFLHALLAISSLESLQVPHARNTRKKLQKKLFVKCVAVFFVCC